MIKSFGGNWVSKLFSGLAVASLVTLAASSAQAQEEKVLNVYNWSDYIAVDTIHLRTRSAGDKRRDQSNTNVSHHRSCR